MSAAFYFKKYTPQNPLRLSTGKSIKFEDMDGTIGFHVTSDPLVVSEFQRCIAENRGGLEVSNQSEYDAAVKKKTDSPALKASLFREHQTSGIIIPSLLVTKAPVASPVVGNGESNGVIGRAAPIVLPEGEKPEPKVSKRPAK